MILTSTELDTTYVVCDRCGDELKALWFDLQRLKDGTYRVNKLCVDCTNDKRCRRKGWTPKPEKNKYVKVVRKTDPPPIEDMYISPDAEIHRWSEAVRRFRYNKFLKKFYEYNDKLYDISKAGFDIENPEHTELIDNFLDKQ